MEYDVSIWVKKAENDWKVVKMIVKNDYEPTDICCYHCHQVAEKYLKGYITFQDREIIKSHNLPKLCRIIMEVDSRFFEIISLLEQLDNYGVSVKYPGDFAFPEKEESNHAVEITKQVRKFCRKALKLKT